MPKKGGRPATAQARAQTCGRQAGAIPPHMLKQMGGMAGLQNMMKQLEGKDMGKMMEQMGSMKGMGKMMKQMGM